MDLSNAAYVLSQLASGRDPTSGEMLPKTSPYHNPTVIRALYAILCHLRENGIAPTPDAAIVAPPKECALQATKQNRWSSPWTPEGDEKLIDEFEATIQFEQIAETHGRPVWAVIKRLKDLGKISSTKGEPRRVPVNEDAKPNPPNKRSQAGKQWRPEEDAALLQYFDEGLSIEEIAERLHRGVHAIGVRLFKLGRTPEGEAGQDIPW